MVGIGYKPCMFDNVKVIRIRPLIFIVAVILGLSVVGIYIISKDSSKNIETNKSTPTAELKQTEYKSVAYKGVTGRTVLDLLKSQVNDGTITAVQTKDSSLGEYVESISGVVGGTDGKYWLFYVNGEPAMVGASEYVTEDGDTIEWRFE